MKLQTQPSSCTCVQTCIAMATGMPVERVIARFNGSAMSHSRLFAALRGLGVECTPLMFPEPLIGWHFATVPSLEDRGMNHQILALFDARGHCVEVLDPSPGAKYTPPEVRSYSELIAFVPTVEAES